MKHTNLALKAILFIGIVLFTISCGDSAPIEETIITTELAKIIHSYTKDEIKPEDNIEVRFQKLMVTQEDVDAKKSVEGAFTFKDEIEGKAYWTDRKTLIFDPNEPLTKWASYYAELDLSKVMTDSLKENMLRFSFSVEGQAITAFENKLSLVKIDDPQWVVLEGKISFQQAIDLEELKKELELEGPQSVNLNISSTDENNKEFMFTSEKLERTNSEQKFKLHIDADAFDLKDDLNKDFYISSISDMKIEKVELQEDGRTPKMSLVFSDEFDFSQNIDGLVKIEPQTEVKLKRSGKRLILDAQFKFGTTYKITLEKGIRSKWGSSLQEQVTETVKIKDIMPQVEFVSDGYINPLYNNYKIQFYTTNLERVHLELKKVYADDISEFVRNERLHSVNDRKQAFDNTYINRTGVIVHNETFDIDQDKNTWKLNEIDLSKVVELDKKALYLVRLNFNKRDILIKDSYADKFIEENGQIYKPVLFSDIGLTAKKTEDNYTVYVSDLKTGKPLKGVLVELRRKYDGYDNPIRDSKISDSKGKVTLHWNDRYFYQYSHYILAHYKDQRSVIKFNEMEWNSSGFDIGGVDYKQDTKVFAYTERGVYRPGDDINLSLIARHHQYKYPSNKPLTMDLYNPEGKKVYEVSSKENKDGFYNFKFETSDSDPTGTWYAKWRLGDRWYNHPVKIETIVPFKLKLKMHPEKAVIDWQEDSLKTELEVKYLFGTPAKKLDAEVEMELNHLNKKFPKYAKFNFSNPGLSYQRNQSKIYTGKLDEDGKAQIRKKLPIFNNVPSAILMKLSTKVLEKGGRPNQHTQYITIDPYAHYVGVQGERYNYFQAGDDMELPVILCDSKGNAVAGKSLKYRIYLNENRWWWDFDRNGKMRFKTDQNTVLVKEGLVETGKEHSIIKYVPIELGCYFIEVIDENGTGHSTGYVFNTYRYGSVPSGQDAGTLNLSADKSSYQVGDVAKVKFPVPQEGSVLLTIEQGNEVISEKWLDVEGEKFMEMEIPITREMVPNAYAVISLMQPHAQTVNDRPIRMYGILPLEVVDPETVQDIDIITSDFFRPKEDFEVKVQMKHKKKTQFTIAVVDEGLLDITAFKTPQPWDYFYQKTRLDVETYDMYNHVINANKGDVFKTFAIGGDMDYRKSQQKKKGKKRFKPVSLFKGVLETDENGYALVKFKMPNYIGSVRIMVIAVEDDAYGSAEKSVPVKSELMIQPSLPRVLGPAETIKVPVSVFAMEPNMGKVKVKIDIEGPISVLGTSEHEFNFSKVDDKDCFFDLKVDDAAGQSKITISATSSQYSAEEITDLMVRPSSPRLYESKEHKLLKTETWTTEVPMIGMEGSNNATLTLSPFPNINFGSRLRYLIRYPYGCLEQTTSSAFPQLYLKDFIEYPEAFAKEIDENINGGIQRLRNFQRYDGNLSYWPYSDYVNSWANLYAGHFMISTKDKGYHIPMDLYENWLTYVSNSSRNGYGDNLRRAYRVYLLALASRSALSEMNILRESHLGQMSNVEKWLLAAAYKLSGQEATASSIIRNISTYAKDYQNFNESFGTSLRDEALMLECAVILEQFDIADQLAQTISKKMSSTSYYSTHSLGVSISALGKYVTHLSKGKPVNIKGTITLASGKTIPFESKKATSIHITGNFGKDIKVSVDPSTTVDHIYATLNYNGVPLHDPTETVSKNLNLAVTYYDEDGNTIDVTSLQQGKTFYARFHIENMSTQNLKELALVQVLPSGWEVENMRLLGQNLPTWMNWTQGSYDYLDIRDDRVMWFFGMCKNHYSCNKKDFVIKLNAVTVGEYELPSTLCEAMYNDEFKATMKGKKVKVTARP